MSSNYPPGVSASHPYFNPPTCPHCGEEGIQEGEECESCGKYIPDEQDYADEAADREYDRQRDEGLR